MACVQCTIGSDQIVAQMIKLSFLLETERAPHATKEWIQSQADWARIKESILFGSVDLSFDDVIVRGEGEYVVDILDSYHALFCKTMLSKSEAEIIYPSCSVSVRAVRKGLDVYLTVDDFVNDRVIENRISVDEFSNCIGDFSDEVTDLLLKEFPEIIKSPAISVASYVNARSLGELFLKWHKKTKGDAFI